MAEQPVYRVWLNHHGFTVLTLRGVPNLDAVEHEQMPMLVFASPETIRRYYYDFGPDALDAFSGTFEDLRVLRIAFAMEEAGYDDVWVPLGDVRTEEHELKVLKEARSRSLLQLLPGVTTSVMSLSQLEN